MQDKNCSFEFEEMICFERPELWILEAHYLFHSAEVLFEFEEARSMDKEKSLENVFSKDVTDRVSFNYRTQRMLWAYGFENLFKNRIIKDFKVKNPTTKKITETLKKEINDHDLIILAEKAGVILTEEDTFYLKILTKCSIWAGRYPLPLKPMHMPEEREGVKSRGELWARSIKLRQDFVNGRIPRIETESDILQTRLGPKEINLYRNLKKLLMG